MNRIYLDKPARFAGYEELFALKKQNTFRKVEDMAFNMRMPEGLDALLKEDLLLIRNELGIKTNKNEWMVFLVMVGMNYVQHPLDPNLFERKTNDASLENFLPSHKLPLLNMFHVE